MSPSRRWIRSLLVCSLASSAHSATDPDASLLRQAFSIEGQALELLATSKEHSAVESLTRVTHQRAFLDRFWELRDPYPETGRNEFHEAWQQRLDLARQRYDSLRDPRAETLLLVGPPSQIELSLCPEYLQPTELWAYEPDSVLQGGATLLFVNAASDRSRYDHWSPNSGVEALLRSGIEIPVDGAIDWLRRHCSRGGQTVELVTQVDDWNTLRERADLVPRPDPAWVDGFLDRVLAIEPSASDFSARLQFEFPGRRARNTIVQTMIAVDRRQLMPHGEVGDGPIRLQVDGEVLLRDRLIDAFRYRFTVAESEPAATVAFQRDLPPGNYTLALKVREEASGRVFYEEGDLHVPTIPDRSSSTDRREPALTDSTAEAVEALSSDSSIRILPLPSELLTGHVRVEVKASGRDLAKVRFELDGRPVMTKTQPPYSVEIDLGRAPRLHTLQAVALDASGTELARDRIPVNAGPHRFAIRLLEPQSHQQYSHTCRASAEVDLPPGASLERVDFYLDEQRLTSLYQEPFVQPIPLPASTGIHYVRAVAVLSDGNSTEDLVFINPPARLERLRINMVELYTSVSDKRGRPIDDLEKSEFTVLEEGVSQSIARFERVRDLPIHAAIVLDTSTSMTEELEEAVEAGLRFFAGVLQPKDRAAVLTFNDEPLLKVPFTNDLQVLAGGLADLESTGDTVLYDALVFALHYFAGIRGKRALILLTDGHDSRSHYSFDEALDFALHSGVAVYTVALGLSTRDLESRMILGQLASQTGGDAFSIDSVKELEAIYDSIERELRSQYLIAYQSDHATGGAFRRVEVQVGRPGLQAKTIRGYYP